MIVKLNKEQIGDALLEYSLNHANELGLPEGTLTLQASIIVSLFGHARAEIQVTNE